VAFQQHANPWWGVDIGAALVVVGVLFTNRAENYGSVQRHFITARSVARRGYAMISCLSVGPSGCNVGEL